MGQCPLCGLQLQHRDNVANVRLGPFVSIDSGERIQMFDARYTHGCNADIYKAHRCKKPPSIECGEHSRPKKEGYWKKSS
ncbi:hypothetical protein FHS72_003619 [Loktanella ponticola]|uniref:Uncharacterized protein n=1 Tax=Yoonia ponticola TaxID=1524255 RepID=A0A7W9BNV8_9RHOB|nr:hypothetical protein [Yoonia ponticola]